MTLALRYHPLGRRFDRPGTDACNSAFGTLTRARTKGPITEEMVDARMEHVQMIRDRVTRDEYKVDAAAVASALLERLLSGGTLR